MKRERCRKSFWEAASEEDDFFFFFFIGNSDEQRSCDSSDTLRLKEYATALPLPPVLSLKVEGNHKCPPSSPPHCHS